MSNSSGPFNVGILLPGGEPSYDSREVTKWEFPGQLPGMNTALIVLRTTYPGVGMYAVNRECDMVVFVHDVAKGGSLGVVFANNPEDLKQECPRGTIISIPRGKAYRWTVSIHATVIIVSNPPWYPEQADVLEPKHQ